MVEKPTPTCYQSIKKFTGKRMCWNKCMNWNANFEQFSDHKPLTIFVYSKSQFELSEKEMELKID